MSSDALVFVLCLLVLGAQAQPASRSSKCKCSNGFVGRINPKLIQAEPVIYQPSVFCPHTEIIITVAHKEKCVNPESPLGKLILKNHQNKKGQKQTMSMTTASGSTTSHTSAELPLQ